MVHEVHPIMCRESLRGGMEVRLHSVFNLSARWEWVVSDMPQPLYPQVSDLVPVVCGLGGSHWGCDTQTDLPAAGHYTHSSSPAAYGFFL